jgi:hypothetical protein
MGIDHRGFDIYMPKQFLNGAGIIPGLMRVGGKAIRFYQAGGQKRIAVVRTLGIAHSNLAGGSSGTVSLIG